jgi:hypothetical protein
MVPSVRRKWREYGASGMSIVIRCTGSTVLSDRRYGKNATCAQKLKEISPLATHYKVAGETGYIEYARASFYSSSLTTFSTRSTIFSCQT